MEIRQRTELRKLLIPQLNQSLKVLALPLNELKETIDSELLNNPLLEESPSLPPSALKRENNPFKNKAPTQEEIDFRLSSIVQKASLQDILLRQLGMFAEDEESFRTGQEIIGNIDDNGYLQAGLDEISAKLGIPAGKAEAALKLIQEFEPAGVGARSVSECLLIQLKLLNETDPLLLKIVQEHIDDIAKKNYAFIAKTLKEPVEKIESAAKKILKLDPKPGRNYSAEKIQQVIPDITIYDKEDEFEININDEDLPTLNINKDYKKMLKSKEIDPQTKEFLLQKYQNALNLLRSIFRRKATLRKIIEVVADIQQEAIRNDLSFLKPLTFKDVAGKINMHESTVCRAVMNKYVRLPFGVIALKDFFPSHINSLDGQSHSSPLIKRMIKDLVDQEDKKHPLSDLDIARKIAQEKSLKVPRRTVAKYREELKILSSSYRRIK